MKKYSLKDIYDLIDELGLGKNDQDDKAEQKRKFNFEI